MNWPEENKTFTSSGDLFTLEGSCKSTIFMCNYFNVFLIKEYLISHTQGFTEVLFTVKNDFLPWTHTNFMVKISLT